MNKRSSILYITHAAPVAPCLGPARRHYNILAQLSRFYDVTLLTLGTSLQKETLNFTWSKRVQHVYFASTHFKGIKKLTRKAVQTIGARCDFLPVLEPNLRQLCGQLLKANSYEAVVLSSVLLRGLPLPEHIPIVGDTHNVEFDVLRRTSIEAENLLRRYHARLQWQSTRMEEERCLGKVDLLLATSERDRQMFMRELRATHVEVIPNGVDITEYAPVTRAAGEEATILFTGLMSYYPNEQAVRWFLNSVFPLILRRRPTAKLIVAGADPPRWMVGLRGYNVEVTESVVDMRPYFQRARVVITPLRIGGGTRVKILEAQAMARPVVSTLLGAEGLKQRDGETILLADNAKLFAQRVLCLLEDPEIAKKIGVNGKDHVASYFDWNIIGEHLAVVLRTKIGLVPRTC